MLTIETIYRTQKLDEIGSNLMLLWYAGHHEAVADEIIVHQFGPYLATYLYGEMEEAGLDEDQRKLQTLLVERNPQI